MLITTRNNTQGSTVSEVAQTVLGWRSVENNDAVADPSASTRVVFTHHGLSVARMNDLKPKQRISYFIGAQDACDKLQSTVLLQSLYSRLWPGHFSFYPKTYLTPNDNDVIAAIKPIKGRFFIMKPAVGGCGGAGISLTHAPAAALRVGLNGSRPMIVQKYISKPLLYRNSKFDIRVYALVTSFDPMKMYVYSDAIARVCTEEYTKPTTDTMRLTLSHLTNYSIQKHADQFTADHKLPLSAIIQDLGLPHDQIWNSIRDVCLKSMTAASLPLRISERLTKNHSFQIFGVDVLFDAKLDAHLMELNHNPSLQIDSEIEFDRLIKSSMIAEALSIAAGKPFDLDAPIIPVGGPYSNPDAGEIEKVAPIGRFIAATPDTAPLYSLPEDEELIHHSQVTWTDLADDGVLDLAGDCFTSAVVDALGAAGRRVGTADFIQNLDSSRFFKLLKTGLHMPVTRVDADLMFTAAKKKLEFLDGMNAIGAMIVILNHIESQIRQKHREMSIADQNDLLLEEVLGLLST